MTLDYWLKGIIYTGAFLAVLVPLLVADSLFFPFITGKAFFFRILVEIIFASWLVLIIRQPEARPKKGIILWATLAWIIVAVIATALSLNPTVSFWSNFERMEGLATFLHIFAYFVVLASVFREKIWMWFLNASLGVSLIIDFIALGEYFGAGTSRVDATLGNPTYLASYLLFHIFIAGLLYHKYAGQIKELKIFYAGAILLNAFVLFQTGTRGTILGLLGGLAVMALVFALFGKEHKRGRKWAISGLAGLLLLTGGFLLIKDTQIVQNNSTLSRLASISLEDNTTKSRFIIWDMALEGFKERPVFGWGFENFSVVFNKHYNPELYDQEQWFDRAHNVFFDWLIGAGILGLLAYLSLFAGALFVIYRSEDFSLFEKSIWLGLLSAYFVHNLFVFDNIVSYLFFFTVLAYLHTEAGGQKVIYTKVANQPVQYSVAVVSVVLLIIASTFFVFKPMMAAENLITGLRQLNSGADSGNAEQLESAKQSFLKAYGQSPTAKKQTAEQLLTNSVSVLNSDEVSAEVKEDILGQASRLMKLEIEADPHSARQWLFYGGYLTNFADQEEVTNALEKALELSPKKPQILFQLAESSLRFGDNIKAKEYSQTAYELAGQFSEAQIRHALILFRIGDSLEAEQLLEKHFGTTAVNDRQLIGYYHQIKKYDLLIEIFQKRVEENPNAENLLNLVNLYISTNNQEAALEVLRQAQEVVEDPSVLTQVNDAIEQLENR